MGKWCGRGDSGANFSDVSIVWRQQKRGKIVDELDLVQETVSNWESLDEVAEVETREVFAGVDGKHAFLSRIHLRGRETPVYIEMRALSSDEDDLEERFSNGRPAAWSRPGFSLN